LLVRRTTARVDSLPCSEGALTMFEPLNEPVFVLTNIGVDTGVDIIGVNTQGNLNIITDYLKEHNIGFVLIDSQDAIKLLLNRGGIGVGCYVTAPLATEIEERRKLEADGRFNKLTDILSISLTQESLGLKLKQTIPVS
jgi:hypothetical protein